MTTGVSHERNGTLGPDVVSALCPRYALGKPTATPQPVAGGLIHRVFRLSTTEGVFAVKVLDPPIMARRGIRDEFRRSERLAAAFAAADVPAVVALEAPGRPVQDIAGVTVIVSPWCHGRVLPKSAAAPHQAHRIGTILGHIHALDLHLPGEVRPSRPRIRRPMPKGEWKELVRQGRSQGVAWGMALEAALPDLLLWDSVGREAERLVSQTRVVSHRDLDQKNVLWRDGDTPFLIDWESAGPTHPAAELIGAALDWSGQSAGPPERVAFAAVIAGYRENSGFPSGVALPLLRGRLAGWIDWLGASMRRSLGSTASDSERAVGVRETEQTLATMYALAAGLETWAGWCD